MPWLTPETDYLHFTMKTPSCWLLVVPLGQLSPMSNFSTNILFYYISGFLFLVLVENTHPANLISVQPIDYRPILLPLDYEHRVAVGVKPITLVNGVIVSGEYRIKTRKGRHEGKQR